MKSEPINTNVPAARLHSLCFVVALGLLVSGCGYSRWGYKFEECNLERESYRVKFQSVMPASHEDADLRKAFRADTLFYYQVDLRQLDTLAPLRYGVRVNRVDIVSTDTARPFRIALCGDSSVIAKPYAEPGMPSWFGVCIQLGPFSVGIPRPDSLIVEQQGVVFDRFTGETLDSLPPRVQAKLAEYRYSHLYDFFGAQVD
jgi:hypothetical protein